MSRILIVEDEGIVAKSIQSRLEKMGYEVPGIIATGEEVLDAAMTLKPDVILMDIHLKSKMDGIDAVEMMKKHIKVPVIYLTAYADDETLQRAVQSGPNGYIVKPFSQVDLRAAIESAIHNFRVQVRKDKEMEHLQEVLNHINDAVLIADKGGEVRSLNRLAMNLTGYKQEAVGLNVHEVIELLDKTQPQLEDYIRKAIQEKKTIHVPGEITLVCKTGVSRDVAISIVPLFDEFAELGAVACIFNLITRPFSKN